MNNERLILMRKKEFEPVKRIDNIYSAQFGRIVLLSYFEALYLSRLVFKKNAKYKFFEDKLIEQIWKTVDEKYDKFVAIEGHRDQTKPNQIVHMIDKKHFGTSESIIPSSSDVEGVYTFEHQAYDIRFDEEDMEMIEPTFLIHYNRRWKKGLYEFAGGVGSNKKLINHHRIISDVIEKFDYQNQKRLGEDTNYVDYLKRKEEE